MFLLAHILLAWRELGAQSLLLHLFVCFLGVVQGSTEARHCGKDEENGAGTQARRGLEGKERPCKFDHMRMGGEGQSLLAEVWAPTWVPNREPVGESRL